MATEQITVRFSKRTRNVFVGKCIVVLLSSIAGGLAMTATDRKHVERAKTLTLEQYTSEFDQYKAALVKDAESQAGNTVGLLIVLAGGFALYEGLGLVLGWALGRVAGSAPNEDAVSLPPSRAGAA
jgi:hypothetical protein